MLNSFRNLIPYSLIGLIFTTLIVFIYDGNIQNLSIIAQGTILFAIITMLMERIMRMVYVRYTLPRILRIQLTVVTGLLLYTLGVWLTKPWLLVKVWNLPVFMITIFPMFLGGTIIFELYIGKLTKEANGKLNQFKRNRNN